MPTAENLRNEFILPDELVKKFSSRKIVYLCLRQKWQSSIILLIIITYMSWFKRLKEGISTSTKNKKVIPDGIWHKCSNCNSASTMKDLKKNFWKMPRMQPPRKNWLCRIL
jgi:hypothetical protein